MRTHKVIPDFRSHTLGGIGVVLFLGSLVHRFGGCNCVVRSPSPVVFLFGFRMGTIPKADGAARREHIGLREDVIQSMKDFPTLVSTPAFFLDWPVDHKAANVMSARELRKLLANLRAQNFLIVDDFVLERDAR